MSQLWKPRAFKTPIWVRSSLTIRVMVVMHTRMAIIIKNTGKRLATPEIMAVSFSKLTKPVFSRRVNT